jgi:hypothetical protein
MTDQAPMQLGAWPEEFHGQPGWGVLGVLTALGVHHDRDVDRGRLLTRLPDDALEVLGAPPFRLRIVLGQLTVGDTLLMRSLATSLAGAAEPDTSPTMLLSPASDHTVADSPSRPAGATADQVTTVTALLTVVAFDTASGAAADVLAWVHQRLTGGDLAKRIPWSVAVDGASEPVFGSALDHLEAACDELLLQ